jgi:hypothetical protein
LTPLHLAHALLSTPELIPLLDEDAANSIAARTKAKGKGLNDRLLDAVEAAWDKRWGDEARHQVRGCRGLFEERAERCAPQRPLVFAALGMLAAELFEFHRGELMLERAAHLNWRELWSATTLLEPARAMAMATTCLKAEGGRAWEPRHLPGAPMEAALDAPALPPVNDAALEALRREGLPELHRHESLTKLPWFVWWQLLHMNPTTAPLPEGEAPTHEPWHLLLARAQRVWRAVDGLLEGRAGAEAEAIVALRPLTSSDELNRWTLTPGATAAEAVSRPEAERGRCAERRLLVRALGHMAERGAGSVLGHCVHALLIIRGLVETHLLHPPQGARGLDRFKEDYVEHRSQSGLSVSPAVVWRQAWEAGAVRWLEVKLGPGSGNSGLWKKSGAWLRSVREEAEAAGCPDCGPRPGDAPAGAWEPAGQGEGCSRPTPEAPKTADERAADAMGKPCARCKRPAIRAVLHFLRKHDDKVEAEPATGGAPQGLGRPRWDRLRGEVANQARQLRDVLHDPVLGRMWVGIDAASYELAAPAEVFAPAFRMLRAPWAIALREETDKPHRAFALRSLAASVHAGEEFTHLAQGMRWVDEHRTFLELRQGDRIGHGLAVGLDPEWWRERTTGRVVQTRQERLDDLVWLWSRLHTERDHAHLCHSLADEAVGLAAAVYTRRATPGELLEAWQLRALDPLLGKPTVDPDSGCVHLPPSGTGALDRAAHQWQVDRLCAASPEAIKLWSLYTWDKAARRAGQERIEVKVERKWDAPLRAVQDAQLRELERAGIAIEANPSSNLAIATLGKLEHHPIFRWLPIKPEERDQKPMPRVCVGSDDPAIFHTELLHEYALLIQAARETERYTEREIRLWIDELRRNGLDLWFDEVHPVR